MMSGPPLRRGGDDDANVPLRRTVAAIYMPIRVNCLYGWIYALFHPYGAFTFPSIEIGPENLVWFTLKASLWGIFSHVSYNNTLIHDLLTFHTINVV